MQTSSAEFERQLRSLFAVLRTLVRQTTQGRESVEDYAAHLEGRIGCLARAHAMVLRAPEEGVDLQELVLGELLSHAVREDQYHVAGPEIRMGRESAAAIALAIHELTINALWHGALRQADGRLTVSWTLERANEMDCLHFDWRERGTGRSELAPSRKGFGTELLERMMPYELNVQPHIEYPVDGIHVTLHLPARATVTIWRTPSASETA